MSVHLGIQLSQSKLRSISGIWWCGQMINWFDIHFHLISETRHLSLHRFDYRDLWTDLIASGKQKMAFYLKTGIWG